jgi:hypothetical protein
MVKLILKTNIFGGAGDVAQYFPSIWEALVHFAAWEREGGKEEGREGEKEGGSEKEKEIQRERENRFLILPYSKTYYKATVVRQFRNDIR